MSTNVIDSLLIDVQRLQDAILNGLSEGVYFVDKNRRILFWNKAAEELTGYSATQVLGRSCADGILMHVDETGKCLCEDGCPLEGAMQDGLPCQAHVFLHHADGHRVPVHVRGSAIYDSQGEIVGSVEVFSDDSDRVGVMTRLKQLEQIALLDELTGLANRRYFNRAFAACLATFERDAMPFGLLMIDIDHFKKINDTYGHDIGDAILRLVAQTLAGNCRAYDTPVRWGGEEFAVLSENVDEDTLYSIAERARILIGQSSYALDGESLSVNVSIGASIARTDDNLEAIIKRADANLYSSKRNGRNQTTIDRTSQSCLNA
ncbi:MAG: sensor domain-containing diguanylate cyclase [Phycisphaerales bacterium]|jgi:diguanylate cyclase (GGDEF)-like protein/PAS domain S-box-containing protein|nr:sensor domain-containing diguanylate cyclase [Phycisphaerales bacterium]